MLNEERILDAKGGIKVFLERVLLHHATHGIAGELDSRKYQGQQPSAQSKGASRRAIRG